MSLDIISLLQEARERVEKTKRAVNQAIKLANVEKDNDELETTGEDSEIHQAEREAFESKLDSDYRNVQIDGIKQELIIQTKNRNKLKNRAAKYGGLTNAPLELQNDIEDIEAVIDELKDKLKELEENF